MPHVYKILGQAAPAADTSADLLTVGTGKSVITSSLTVCNFGPIASPVRVAARPSGETLATKHRIVHDLIVNPGDTLILQPGLTLAAGAVVTVSSAAGTVAFGLYGTEVA